MAFPPESVKIRTGSTDQVSECRCSKTLGVELDVRELAAALAEFAGALCEWHEYRRSIRMHAMRRAIKRLHDVATGISGS